MASSPSAASEPYGKQKHRAWTWATLAFGVLVAAVIRTIFLALVKQEYFATLVGFLFFLAVLFGSYASRNLRWRKRAYAARPPASTSQQLNRGWNGELIPERASSLV